MKFKSITCDVHYLYFLTEDDRVFRFEKQHPEKGLEEIILVHDSCLQ